MLQIDFRNVERLYGNKPVEVMECYISPAGWCKMNPFAPLKEANELNVSKLAELGAESFQFKVIDENGAECYPDFKLTELLKQ